MNFEFYISAHGHCALTSQTCAQHLPSNPQVSVEAALTPTIPTSSKWPTPLSA